MTERSAPRFLRQFEPYGALAALGLSLALLLAFALPTLPTGAYSLNILVVVLGLLLAGLPLAMAEQAMATRAKVSMVPGMQLLTRESDAPRFWRILSWSSLGASIAATGLVAVIAGEKLTGVLQTLLHPMGFAIRGSDFWPLMSLFVLWLGATRVIRQWLLRRWLLPALLLGLCVVQVLAGKFEPKSLDFMHAAMFPASGGLLLGILAAGAGVGAYWASLDHDARWTWRDRLIAIVSFSTMLWAFQAGPATLATLLLGLVVTLLGLRALMAPFFAHARSSAWSPWVAPMAMLTLFFLLIEAVWSMSGDDALPTLIELMAAWISVNLLLTALYAGWVMKISHLRKALALPSEVAYNLWRVLVRWVAPITLVVAWWQVYRG